MKRIMSLALVLMMLLNVAVPTVNVFAEDGATVVSQEDNAQTEDAKDTNEVVTDAQAGEPQTDNGNADQQSGDANVDKTAEETAPANTEGSAEATDKTAEEKELTDEEMLAGALTADAPKDITDLVERSKPDVYDIDSEGNIKWLIRNGQVVKYKNGKESTDPDAKLHVVDPHRRIEFKYTWHISEENMKKVKVGDFFSFQLPTNDFLGAFSFNFDEPIRIDSEENFPDGLGSFTISDKGKLTATLNQNISGKLLIKNGEFLVRYAVAKDKKVTVDVDVPHDATAEAIAIHGENVTPSGAPEGTNEYKSLGKLVKDGGYISDTFYIDNDSKTNPKVKKFRGMVWYLRAGHDQYKLLLETRAAGNDPMDLINEGLKPRKNVWLYDEISDPNMVIERDRPFEIRPYAYLMTKEGNLSTFAYATPVHYIKKAKFKVPNPGESYEDFKSRMQSGPDMLKPLEEVAIYPATADKGERIIVNYGDLDISNPKEYLSKYISNMALVNDLDKKLAENKITPEQREYNIKAYNLQKSVDYKNQLTQQLNSGQITKEQYADLLKKGIPNDKEGNRSIPNLYYTTVFYTKSTVVKGDYINIGRMEWNTTESFSSNPKKVVYQEAVGKAGLEDLTSFSVKKIWKGKVAAEEITVVLTGDDTENGKTPSKYEYVLSKSNDWSGVVSRVRKNKEVIENGQKKVVPITYTVSEKDVLPNYTVVEKKNENGFDFVLTNTNTETVRLTVDKTWAANKVPGNSNGTVFVNIYDSRDTNFEYPVKKDQPVTYDATSQKGTLEVELPKYHLGDKYDGNVPVEYVVKELANDGVTLLENKPSYDHAAGTQTIKLKNTVNTKIILKKLWLTSEGKVNPTATILIKNGDKEVARMETATDKEMTYFLPEFDNANKPITYTVEEAAIDGYSSHKEESVQDGAKKYTFSNRELHNLQVTKKWNNGNTPVSKAVKLTLYYKNSNNEAFKKEYIDVDTKITAVYTNASGEQAAPLDNTDGKVKFTLPADSVDGVLLIKGLPYRDKLGNTLYYSVREDEVEGFLPCIVCHDNKHQEKTLYNLASKTLTLKKAWAVSSDAQKRDVEFILTNNGSAFDYNIAEVIKKANPSVTVEANKIKVTVPKAVGEVRLTVPAYDLKNQEINYKVEEVQLDGFYAPKYDYSTPNQITVKNISNETVSVKVKKVWRHPQGTPEKNVTIAVRPAQNPEKAVVLPKAGVDGDAKWEHTFEGLPKFDSETGELIIYKVEETGKPAGYNVDYSKEGDKQLVINTIEGKVSISVSKKWLGAIKADSVTVGLFQNDVDTNKRAVLRAKAGDTDPKVWTDNVTFVDLPQYDGSGVPYRYTVKEIKIGDVDVVNNETADYKVTVNNYEIINYNKEKIEVPFIKTWVGKPAAQVVFRLKADGNVTGQSVTLTAADVIKATETDEWEGKVSWAGKFTNLPKYSETDGHVIVYTVEEEVVAGYTLEQKGNEFINTNTEKIEVSVEKRWVNSSVESVQIELLADGKKVNGITLKAPWKHTFTDLFKYDQTTGKEIVYTVVEKEVPNFKTTYEGDMKNGLIVVNTYIPPIPPYVPEVPGGDGDKPNPPTTTDDIPGEPTPEGEPNKPTPPTPTTPPTPGTPPTEPSVPEEEIPTDPIPQGNTELPKTDGIPAGMLWLLGLGLTGLGLFFKKEK